MRIHKEKGVTLIELMVSLVISTIIVLASYEAFVFQHKTYIFQENLTDMQQSTRVALDLMTREIRMAGYRADILEATGNIAGYTRIITPGNDANHVSNHDDQITVIIADQAITYRLQSKPSAPSIPVLVREEHTGAGREIAAEQVENLQFRYRLQDGTVMDSPTNPEAIRGVEVTMTFRIKLNGLHSGGDGYHRRTLSSFTKVRNLGL